jgi:hypothetical protein
MYTPHYVHLRSFTTVPLQQEGSHRHSDVVEAAINTTQDKRLFRNPTPIELHARTSEDVETTRGAILSYDPASDNNIISHNLVTKVLGEQIHPFNHTVVAPIQTHTGEEVGGYVDLDWYFASKKPRWNTSRFLVTTTYDAPYDAVLGKKDAEQYGLLRSRRRR